MTRTLFSVCVLLLFSGSCTTSEQIGETSTRTIQLASSEPGLGYIPALDGPLRALSLIPFGPLTALPDGQQISITFSRPMVPLGEAPIPDAQQLVILPPIAGSLGWTGTQTLVFTPNERLPYSTEFQVSIRPGLVSVAGDTLTDSIDWTFATPSPAIISTVPASGSQHVRPTDTLFVYFNQPVDAGTVSQNISVSADRNAAIDARFESVSPNGIRIIPAKHLPRNAAVRLRARAGLAGIEGKMPMASDSSFHFRTFGPLQLRSTSGSGAASYAAGSALMFQFNNPVTMKSLRAALELTPSTEFAPGTKPNDSEVSTHLRWPIELLPSTRYTITLDGLQDIFGQSLPRVVRSFTSGEYRPEISLPTGVLVVERHEKARLSVSSVNVQGALLGIKRIAVDEIIPNLAAFGEAYPDFYAERDDLGFKMQPLDLSAAKNKWQLMPLDLSPALSATAGVVLVNAFVPKQRDWYGGRSYRSIAQVTDLGITAKYSPHQILVFVTSLRDGTPIANADVSIRDDRNQVKWSGTTAADGRVLAPGWDALGIEQESVWTRPNVHLFVSKDGDFAFSTSRNNRGIEPYRMGVNYDWSPQVRNYGASVFTDRGLYRTGETVSLKAIIRERQDANWRPYSDSVVVIISSPRDERILTRTMLASDYGSVDWQWTIPTGSGQGTYFVRLFDKIPSEDEYYDSGIGSGFFRVDAFRTSTFAVTSISSADSYVAGDLMEGRITGRYLFGAAMGGQPVSYSVTRNGTYYAPPGYEDYRFGGTSYWHGGTEFYQRIARADTVLNSDGEVSVRVSLPGNELGRVASVALEGTVTDPARQSLSARKSVLLHPALFYIGLKPGTTFLDLSKTNRQTVDVIAVDPQGAPVSASNIAVSVLRQQWNSVREVGADGRLRWRSNVTEESINTTRVNVGRGTGQQISFTVEEGGSYIVRAVSRDLRGNAVQTDAYFYATGRGYVAWERSDDDLIELVADRQNYKPGDVASILVPSPYESATALVTVEREGIISSRVVELVGSAPKIEIPLSENHLPNAFVSVILLAGRTGSPEGMQDIGAPSFKIGYANLTVDPGLHRLSVSVHPRSTQHRPGDEVTVDLSVRDHKNRGVAAEISFSAADAGVLNLIKYALPDPFETFYGQRPLGVSTTESRSHLVRQRNFGQKEEDTGGGGGGGEQFRSDFSPLAHWDPAIRTDASGRATITFRFPESLTTFRLMATAATRDSKFGSGQAEVVVTKPLVLQQALPRFARLGDRFTAGVLISNRTDVSASATVSARPEGISLDGPNTKDVVLPAGETREVTFDWSVSDPGTAVIDFAAALGDERDALRTTLPISVPTTKNTTATFAQTDSSANESIRLDPTRVKSLDRMSAATASTALVGLGGAVEYLFEYPYGCLEQRTSRIRPLLIASDLVDAFGIELLDGKSNDLVAEWLAELQGYWTGTGFSLWAGGRYTPPYVSAYVVAALAEASDAGYAVPKGLTADAVNALERMARRSSDKPEYYGRNAWRVSRAFMLYALALHDRVLTDEITTLAVEELENRDGGTIETVAYLLRTIERAHGNSALDAYRERLIARLTSSLTVEATTVFANIPDDRDYWWIFSNTNRATALSVTALAEAGKDESTRLLSQRMIRYLLSKRADGRWASTQENITMVEAFATYFRRYEGIEPQFLATISVAGREVISETIDGRRSEGLQHEIDISALADRIDVPIAIRKKGVGTLFYSLQLDTYSTLPQKAASNGLTVSRSIQRLDSAGRESGPASVVSNSPLSLKAGDLVRVTLRLVTNADRNYLVVDDALPAGLEALNSAFDTTNREQTQDSGTSRWWGSFNHSEIRDNRVLLFADYLLRGEHTYTYVARATTAGTFVYPPVSAELMYEPSVNGRTSTGQLVVK